MGQLTKLELYALIDRSSLSVEEKSGYRSRIESFLKSSTTGTNVANRSQLLSSIPETTTFSVLPIATLSILLDEVRSGWPCLELIRCYNRLWQALPEELKVRTYSKESAIIEGTLHEVKSTYQSLVDLFHSNESRPALIDPTNGRSIGHRKLAQFVSNFRLPISTGTTKKPVVVIAIPNGPLLGLACIAVSTYYQAVPINASGGSEQFRVDVQQVNANVILVSRAYLQTLGLDQIWITDSGIQVLIVDPKDDLTFSLSPTVPPKQSLTTHPVPNTADDIAFILFTSGTSGTKKLVPLTLHTIVAGVAFVVESWGLSRSDCCLNMMPLNHVGGLVRNLFAPVIAGGSTVCCSAFDPNLFWDVVEEYSPSWYYASPSMHSTILSEAPFRSAALAKHRIRLVCNAAGGLLPSLAIQIRDTFNCIVLPSYGMTECMPISTPPLDYSLDRPGTSGISVGPEIAVLGADDSYLPPHTVGHICVRGSPTFPGYLTQSGHLDTSVFNSSGWFNTGDMGYLDDDKYLYVTGRSKEVINRGGEIISPLEVEEAIMKASNDSGSPIHKKIKECLVFSVPHDVLQEVVGIVVVSRDDNQRPDLRQLHEALKMSLHHVKLPVVMVYMNGLPRNNNKILRVKMAERLGIETISDETLMAERHFEAVCPPADMPLTHPIESRVCDMSLDSIESMVKQLTGPLIESHISLNPRDGLPKLILAPAPQPIKPGTPNDNLVQDLKDSIHSQLHGYLVPSSIHLLHTPFPRNALGQVDFERLDQLLEQREKINSATIMSFPENEICNIFADLLSVSLSEISLDTDFFDAGGDSLKAGRLLSIIRKDLSVRIPVELLFTNSTVRKLSDLIRHRLSISEENNDQFNSDEKIREEEHYRKSQHEKTYSSTNPFLMIIQLIPMFVFYPMRRALEWTILLFALSTALTIWSTGTTIFTRLLMLFISVIIARLSTQVVAPTFAIIAKWLIIGRYKEGLYPMWGSYHTRWWLVQKILSTGGKGVYNRFAWSRILYYRLLGAKIGQNVDIDPGATLGEYDLLEIGDGVQLENCVCRPFGAENNATMYLGRIKLGERSTIGLKAFVAPGTNLPPETCIGPNSSTWEIKDATESNRDLLRNRVPQPKFVTQLFLGWPIVLIINLIALAPRAGGLVGLVKDEPSIQPDMVKSVIAWFSSVDRVGYHFLALVLGSTFGHVIYIFCVIILKRSMDFVFGKVPAGPALSRRELDKFRMWLMKTLLPNGDLSAVTEFFGTHYSVTSWFVRALGGKVGKRVYWPGHGPSVQDFDLIDIRDDVVFGSRSHIVTSDGSGSQHVRIESGCMVADRVILLPGTQLQKNVVLGSGALTTRDTTYINDTTWVGSKAGSPICLTATDRKPSYVSSIAFVMGETAHSGMFSPGASTKSTLVDSNIRSVATTPMSEDLKTLSQEPENFSSSPFGRAFYEGKADYHVIGLFGIFMYSASIKILVTIYWNVTTVSTVQLLNVVEKASPPVLSNIASRPVVIWALSCAFVSFLLMIQSIVAILVVIASKWLLVGQRQPGSYDWDKSSYCQRWQILLTMEHFRRDCFGGDGIIGMLTGTHYATMYFRALGAKIGKDCALFAGGKPSLLFTEPDLLTLGDRVTVDDASLVSHINSRGNFSLNHLVVGDRAVLRSGSRLLSGAQMDDDSCLLEHTLVMGGDDIEQGSTYQGWPADTFHGDRVKRCKCCGHVGE